MRTTIVPIKKSTDYRDFFGNYNGKRRVRFRVSFYGGQNATRTCQYVVLGRKTNTETCVYVGLNRAINFVWQPRGRRQTDY